MVAPFGSFGRADAQILAHHEALTVVIVDAESQLQVGVALEGPGRVPPAGPPRPGQRGKAGLPVVGTYFTLVASPSTAAATALQKATSKPDQLPFASGAAKPIRPVFTPQFSTPRALTSFSVSPSAAMAARPGQRQCGDGAEIYRFVHGFPHCCFGLAGKNNHMRGQAQSA